MTVPDGSAPAALEHCYDGERGGDAEHAGHPDAPAARPLHLMDHRRLGGDRHGDVVDGRHPGVALQAVQLLGDPRDDLTLPCRRLVGGGRDDLDVQDLLGEVGGPLAARVGQADRPAVTYPLADERRVRGGVLGDRGRPRDRLGDHARRDDQVLGGGAQRVRVRGARRREEHDLRAAPEDAVVQRRGVHESERRHRARHQDDPAPQRRTYQIPEPHRISAISLRLSRSAISRSG